MILAFYEFMGDISILEAEIYAIWRALFLPNWYSVCIETDSKTAVNLIKSLKSGPWNCQAMVISIRKLIMEMGASVTHIIREGNRGADYVARKGILNHSAAQWTDREKDKDLRALIRADDFQFIRIRQK